VRGAAEIAGLFAAGALPPLAALAIGLWMLAPLSLRPRGAERLALAFVLGSGTASLAILVLRAVAVPIPLWACAAVAALAVPKLRADRDDTAAPRAPWVRALDAALIALAAFTFIAALAPETAWDGFEYHLPMVRAWSEGPIRALPGQLDAEFRAAVDLLYVPAVAAGHPDAAATISACFALALAALIRGEVSRRAGSGAGSLAALFVLMAPMVTSPLDGAPTTYVDLAVGAYGFVALLFADRWNRGSDGNVLVVSALCLAFAANAKLHAFVLCPAVLLIVLLGGRTPDVRRLATSVALVAAVTAPWFVKAALTVGNPFFPLMTGALGAGPWSPELLDLRRFRLSTDVRLGTNVTGFARYLFEIQAGRNPHVGGLLGPLPLALAPLAIHRLSRPTAVLTATLAALFVLQFVAMPALRFGTPLLAFAAVAAGVGGARLARSGRAAHVVLGGLLAIVAVSQVAELALRYGPRVAALRNPGAYEARMFPDQAALREVVAAAPPVVAIPMGAVSWMPVPVYNLLWERNGELVFRDLQGGRGDDRVRVPRTPADQAFEILTKRGVRSLVIDTAPPHPRDGRVGHPTVDAWLGQGRAVLRHDPEPKPARGRRVWVTVQLIQD
jgi:hypothetical protein